VLPDAVEVLESELSFARLGHGLETTEPEETSTKNPTGVYDRNAKQPKNRSNGGHVLLDRPSLQTGLLTPHCERGEERRSEGIGPRGVSRDALLRNKHCETSRRSTKACPSGLSHPIVHGRDGSKQAVPGVDSRALRLPWGSSKPTNLGGYGCFDS
jgi:hypothetical protein